MPYTTIITEGGLLPADVLDAVATEHAAGQRPEDFGLERGRNLSDRIAAAWQAARGQWLLFTNYRDDLREGDPATSVTRQRWVLPLLDVLGYQPTLNGAAYQLNARTYAISHRAGPHEDAPPIHIEGVNTRLDTRPPSGRPRLSPHALVQEYLNGTEHLWGIVTNGERLRLLRDSSRFTRPAYVEFDLRAMFEGEKFSEFALLYRLLHRSRLPHDSTDAATCWLEAYHQQAVESGGRVREKLRDGVELALKTLGNGLLTHPDNGALRAKIASGQLSPLGYYRQLLKLIYRLLFLMVAEERGLIAAGTRVFTSTDDDPFEVSSVQSFDALLSRLVRGPSATERLRIYYDHYSVARLRRMAEQPGVGRGPYDDLWKGLQTTFRLLEGSDEQNPRSLGVAPLDGDLFGPSAIADLEDQSLRNGDLIAAIRALSLYQDSASHAMRRVNYGALDVEELGSVYESLLDFRPVISPDPLHFALMSGTERKTTGSYYTRPELVQELITSALVPVIDERLRAARARLPASPERTAAEERALLSLTVCDPACGSGHFLLAAARRLGRELARVRSGEDQPTPADFRAAVRDVIEHCIYGVDLNPLAVDLCKLALWIEGHNAGRPLSFLDHHIRHGNSLIGATGALVAGGIPDDAFKPVTGDDKAVAASAKKRNRTERNELAESVRQQSLFAGAAPDLLGSLAADFRELDTMETGTVAAVRAKARRFRELEDAADAELTRFNLWTAAFFQPLTPASSAALITTGTLDDYQHARASVRADTIGLATGLAAEAGFFHWELAFPTVFAEGRRQTADGAPGFDVVLGNPPWERIKLQEQEHFVDVAEIAKAGNKAARERAIQHWRTGSPTQRARIAEFDSAKHNAESGSRFVRASGRYPLTAVGDVNTYALFAEHARSLIDATGRAGVIVQSGIATDDNNKYFFGDLVIRKHLVSFYDFVNTEGVFPGIHRTHPHFCAMTISGGQYDKPVNFAFYLTRPSHLQDQERLFTLSTTDLQLINPNTRTAPVFRTRADADLTRSIYRRVPVLVNEATGANPWGVSFMRMFDMSNDSHLFENEPGEGMLPLYESKLLHQFTHRWATYAGDDVREMTSDELRDPEQIITPRYWVEQREVEMRLTERNWDRGWLLGFRGITNATNERTAIFAAVPYAALGNSAPVVLMDNPHMLQVCGLLASLSSMVFDFVTRQKTGGTNFNFFIVNQLPVLPPTAFSAADIGYIVPRVLELVYTAWDMEPFAADIWAESDDALRAGIAAQWQANQRGVGQPGGAVLAGQATPPPFIWDDERRAIIRAELDARIARLYGLTRDELRYILDPQDVYGDTFPGETFRVLKEKEQRQYGEYRTRRLILAAWDAG